MIWRISSILLLLSALFVACGTSGPSPGDEKAAPLFIGNLRYIAENCGQEPPGSECQWRTDYIAEACALANVGGGEFSQFEDCHLSDYFAPFCERLEVIASEPNVVARPHLIELAQDIEDAIGG